MSEAALNRKLSLDCGVLRMITVVLHRGLYVETLLLQLDDFVHHRGLLSLLRGFRPELLWCSPAQDGPHHLPMLQTGDGTVYLSLFRVFFSGVCIPFVGVLA